MMRPIILSLCDHSGVWSQPYREAGYDVRQVDLGHGQDVRLLELPDAPVAGVLAAPPCTVFSIAGAWVERTPQEWLDALSIADACLRLVTLTRPRWWALENPASSRLAKWYGPPSWTFEPFAYGDPWTKKTGIWGTAVKPPATKMVSPEFTNGRDRTTNLCGSTEEGKRARSMTPPGFARAFAEVNP